MSDEKQIYLAEAIGHVPVTQSKRACTRLRQKTGPAPPGLIIGLALRGVKAPRETRSAPNPPGCEKLARSARNWSLRRCAARMGGCRARYHQDATATDNRQTRRSQVHGKLPDPRRFSGSALRFGHVAGSGLRDGRPPRSLAITAHETLRSVRAESAPVAGVGVVLARTYGGLALPASTLSQRTCRTLRAGRPQASRAGTKSPVERVDIGLHASPRPCRCPPNWPRGDAPPSSSIRTRHGRQCRVHAFVTALTLVEGCRQYGSFG